MSTSSYFIYPILFFSTYVQVFLFVTFLEKRKHILVRKEAIELPEYPSVTIIVPCYNEEKTISNTIKSLFDLDYPKEKLKIILIDDGSTDNTYSVLKTFESTNNVLVLKKTNGGKHTALNLGLEHTDTDFVGCLDSDSYVHPQALKRIINTFIHDISLSAVVPSVLVGKAKNIVEKAQRAEYDLAVYNKKMLGFLGAIHVTPGPFSIFKKKVFNEIGNYRKAHNTEDQEIALRMHKYGYKIDNCPDAYVYTPAPNTIGKLYRQRVRWVYGFLRNMVDYRNLIFKKEFGNLGFFTLPSGIVSLVGVVTMFTILIINIISFIYRKIIQIKTVGLPAKFGVSAPDLFFLNTNTLLFIIISTYFFLILAIMVGRKISKGKYSVPYDVLFLIPFYSLVAPFWIIKSFWNAIFKKETSWVAERKAV